MQSATGGTRFSPRGFVVTPACVLHRVTDLPSLCLLSFHALAGKLRDSKKTSVFVVWMCRNYVKMVGFACSFQFTFYLWFLAFYLEEGRNVSIDTLRLG